ncbi:MAG: hypothetical protein PHY45_03975 [Rhodocyclaceae bacterium]|nr:hypothetical protein [Rhodocyclaceae bacterium]
MLDAQSAAARHHAADGTSGGGYQETSMAGGWGCPHEANDVCTKVNNLPCDPGMKGCVLYGRYVFANDEKNARLRQKQARSGDAAAAADSEDTP